MNLQYICLRTSYSADLLLYLFFYSPRSEYGIHDTRRIQPYNNVGIGTRTFLHTFGLHVPIHLLQVD